MINSFCFIKFCVLNDQVQRCDALLCALAVPYAFRGNDIPGRFYFFVKIFNIFFNSFLRLNVDQILLLVFQKQVV